ncbi:MAG: S8 family serine peptidase, partial [Clostridia bacterium]
MKRVIVFLITLAILSPMLFNMGLGSAVFNTNPFNFFDENRRNMICGKQSSLSSPMPSKIIDGASSYIVTFYASVPLTVIHDAICKFEFRPLAFSEQRVFLLTLPPKSDFAKKNKNIIKSIEEDKIGYTFSEESLSNPNDDSNSDINLIQEISDVPNAMTLWELDSIGAYDAWKTTNGKPSTITAILDSGIDRSHPSFSGAIILDGYDATKKIPYTNTDESGHGTKVAGIIVANGKKGVSASGVAKQISILPIKISKNGIDILTSSLVDGLYFATDSGANVINMSFGGYDIVQAESDAINYAYKQGCILVAAAGNDGNSPIHAGKRSYPASYDGVISVASFAQGGIACGFSQYNDRVDISAPGERLTVLVMKNGKPTTIYENGTSFSAAYVSAAAALAVSISPQPINSDTFERLLEYSSSEKRDDYYGHGLLNIPELLKNVFYPVVFGVKDGNTYFDSV